MPQQLGSVAEMVLLGLMRAGPAPMPGGMASPKPRPGEQFGPTVGKLRHRSGRTPDCRMLEPSCAKNILLQVAAEPCRCEVPAETDSLADGS